METFWAKVRKRGRSSRACWEWVGARHGFGYGVFRYQGASQKAHRVAWALAHGELPAACVLHRCDNPACVRLSHLFIGSKADNTRDMVQKGRWVAPPRALGVANASSKLTDDAVRGIRSAYAGGATQAEVGKLFGVSQPMVGRIARRTAWAHVS